MRSSGREVLGFSRFSLIRSEFDSFSRHDDRDESGSSVALSVSPDHGIAKVIVHEVKEGVMLLTIREDLG
jgi:hypothetical protein